MHMADALLSPAVAATMYVASGTAAGISIYQLKKDNDAAARSGRPIAIELKVLKNRSGAKGSCGFDYYPMFNVFVEA